MQRRDNKWHAQPKERKKRQKKKAEKEEEREQEQESKQKKQTDAHERDETQLMLRREGTPLMEADNLLLQVGLLLEELPPLKRELMDLCTGACPFSGCPAALVHVGAQLVQLFALLLVLRPQLEDHILRLAQILLETSDSPLFRKHVVLGKSTTTARGMRGRGTQRQHGRAVRKG